MTPALDALLGDVARLDAYAVDGPWMTMLVGNDAVNVYAAPDSVGGGHPIAMLGGTRCCMDKIPSNAAAIAHYRTAAPRLAAMLRVAVVALDAVSCGGVMFGETMSAAVAAHNLSVIEAMAKGEIDGPPEPLVQQGGA